MGSVRSDQLDYHGPLVFERGEGIYLYDVDGRRFIDGMSGAWVVNVGHGRRSVVDAMTHQAQQLAYVLHEGYTTPVAIVLAERLSALTAPGLDRVYFSTGGSEAVETALKVAKQYYVARGEIRRKVIARDLSYHGATYGAMSVTGFEDWRWPFAPPVPGSKFAPHPHCYRCPLGLSRPTCASACVAEIEFMIQREGPQNIAAVIAEPVSAASAVSIPPPDYWPRLRDICDRYGILLIADEMVTGFGRTGMMFGLDHWGVAPDILVTGKGLASGYAPLAATIVRQDIAQALDSTGFVHGFTFSAHPVACAAALETIALLTEERLIDNARQQGEYLFHALHRACGNSPVVGDIRVQGLLASIELVRDRTTKEQFPSGLHIEDITKQFLLEHGLICRTGNQILLGPPLCITPDQVDEVVSTISDCVAYLETRLAHGTN